jgi:hypothetical protein
MSSDSDDCSLSAGIPMRCQTSNLLAQTIIIMTTFTLEKQNLHTFSHVDPQKLVRVANDSRRCGEYGSFENGILTEVALSESLHSEIPLDDKSAVQTTENSKNDVEEDFEEMPLAIVAHSKHDELPCTEGIHGLGCVSLSYYERMKKTRTESTAVATRAQK